MSDFPTLTREQYFQKLRDWARVYSESDEPAQNWWGGKKQFLESFEKVITWADSIVHSPEGTAEDYCLRILEASRELPEPVRKVFGSIHLRVHKSNCLGRLLYGGEDLRTDPCPQHKGMWVGPHNGHCPCQGTGWLPNKEESKNE